MSEQTDVIEIKIVVEETANSNVNHEELIVVPEGIQVVPAPLTENQEQIETKKLQASFDEDLGNYSYKF